MQYYYYLLLVVFKTFFFKFDQDGFLFFLSNQFCLQGRSTRSVHALSVRTVCLYHYRSCDPNFQLCSFWTLNFKTYFWFSVEYLLITTHPVGFMFSQGHQVHFGFQSNEVTRICSINNNYTYVMQTIISNYIEIQDEFFHFSG